MAICWINNTRYDINDWEADFSDKELWSEFIQELQEENTIMNATKDLIKDKYITVKDENDTLVESNVAITSIESKISDNQDTINFIKFALEE